MNTRTRAAIANVRGLIDLRQSIWLMEQTTALFRLLAQSYPRLIGSEYLGESFVGGEIDENGIRHEDCTNASLEDESVSAVLSFDVLEHVPDYRQALREVHRVLETNGLFFWSAPFLIDTLETLHRSVVLPNCEIQHLMPPEYHGDPINPKGGILTYQHFGWDVLELMRGIGFRDVRLRIYWNLAEGVVGPEQLFILGRK